MPQASHAAHLHPHFSAIATIIGRLNATGKCGEIVTCACAGVPQAICERRDHVRDWVVGPAGQGVGGHRVQPRHGSGAELAGAWRLALPLTRIAHHHTHHTISDLPMLLRLQSTTCSRLCAWHAAKTGGLYPDDAAMQSLKHHSAGATPERGASKLPCACICTQVLVPLGVAAFCGWKWYNRVYRPRRKSRKEKEKDHLLRSGSQQRDVRDLNV